MGAKQSTLKYQITIKCNNAAFDPAEPAVEVQRILEELVRKLPRPYEFKLFDINGNHVGTAGFVRQ